MVVRSARFLIASVLTATTVFGCGEQNANLQTTEETQAVEQLVGNDELLGLTQAQCTTTALNSVTASPRGQLYINSPAVLNDNRSKNSVNNSGPGGAWSFANALREILELPTDPGNSAANLLAEEQAVDSFIDMFGSQTVNGVNAAERKNTVIALKRMWGIRMDANGTVRRWLGGAPFKLVAIVNRMDIVKRTSSGAVDSTTAGEGRLVFGFTGSSSMTVIFEYNLPVGTVSPTGGITQASWTVLWRDLKNHLSDTNNSRSGVQPDQSLTSQPIFSNQASYLNALEGITNRFVRRTSQKRAATGTATQAAIAQIRTNEFLGSPWELREIVRVRNSLSKAVLQATTTKNSLGVGSGITGSGLTSRSDADLGAWIDGNVTCSNPNDISSCRFSASNHQMPESFSRNGKSFKSGPSSEANFGRWFSSDSSNIKRRFFALESCDGCHSSETNVFFTHTSPFNGDPSAFLTNASTIGAFRVEADLARRLRNFKNLVCLASPTAAGLNLGVSAPVVAPLEKRVGTSSSVH